MGDHDTLLCLAAATALFWYYRGYLGEGRRWLDQALATPAHASSSRSRAWALTLNGMLANVSGETDRASALLTESFSWWEQTDDVFGRAFADTLLGGVYVNQARYDEAVPLFTAHDAYLRHMNHADLLGIRSFHLGLIAWVQGDDARARGLLLDAVESLDRYGTPLDAIDPLRYLGLIACAGGDRDEAVNWFREAWTRLRQRGSRAALAVGLADVATLAAAWEAWLPAVRLFAKAEALLQTEAAAFTLPARDHYERAYRRAMAALGADASIVVAAGRALSLEQALAEAEAVLERDRAGSAETPSGPDAGSL
jgi:non-specific serine/threonine protein kinase